jgi:hypothetical protein
MKWEAILVSANRLDVLAWMASKDLAVSMPITVKTNLPMPLRWHTKLVISLSLMQEIGNHNDIIARATTIPTMEG